MSKRKPTENQVAVKRVLNDKQIFKTIKRTSPLSQPIVQLEGHLKAVTTCQFANFEGKQIIASAAQDGMIMLWNAWEQVENTGVLKSEKKEAAILQIQWSRDANQIYAASADGSVSIWDINAGERVKRFRGHKSIVNSISTPKRGQDLISSVSDDGLIKVWDVRVKDSVKTFESPYPNLSTAFSRDGEIVYFAGIDNVIHAWDLKSDSLVYGLKGHVDSVTGLKLSPSGDRLLSNSMDNTVCVWDIRPFSISETRFEKSFLGAPHGFEKNLIRPCWSPDGDYVACGGGDRSVTIWEAASGKLVFKLPGHKGCVNEVDWADNMILSGSNDQTLFLGELDLSQLD